MVREIVPPETGLAFAPMRALRTDLADEAAFVRRVDEVQRPEGYRLVGAFAEGTPRAVAVAGFRVAHSLSWGRFLYVDDLSTLPEARPPGPRARAAGLAVHRGPTPGLRSAPPGLRRGARARRRSPAVPQRRPG